MTKLESIQKELRHQRQDLVDIKRMLNRLMIDKHLQTQVDNYFNESYEGEELPQKPGSQEDPRSEDKTDID